MRYVIGVDEAGYGPNFGPLVIGASAWDVDDIADEIQDAPRHPPDLYERLSGAVSAKTSAGKTSVLPLLIADSKQVYRAGKGLDQLELGVLAALQSLGRRNSSWQELCRSVTDDDLSEADLPEWYAQYSGQFPTTADPGAVDTACAGLESAFQQAGVRLRGLACRMIFPQEFNQRVDECGSKGVVLSEASVALAEQMIAQLEAAQHSSATARDKWSSKNQTSDQGAQTRAAGNLLVQERPATGKPTTPADVHVFCDKHGGRNKYAGLLQHVFPDALPRIETEGPRASAYRCRRGPQTVHLRFEVGGERHLPVALASMAAKYLRETVMHAFNAFWQQHVPGLRPTAGYPVDARRFRAEIAVKLAELQIPARQIWRDR